MSERIASVLLVLALSMPATSALAGIPDPTRPAAGAVVATTGEAESAPTATLVLQSTLVSPGQRSAIINGRRYRQGDTVGDARIAAIGAGWVRLESPAGSTELRLSYSKPNPPVNR